MRQSCSGTAPADGDDDNGHGTHAAGTVAAIDNGAGVVGVAPVARLRAVKVLSSSGSGWTSWIIAGIDYVTKNAATIEVANMSLGGSGADDGESCSATTDAQKKAICNSVDEGVVYAVAAGTWAGTTASDVDVHRNGAKIATTANEGACTDNIDSKGGGTYTYKLCEAGTTTCSNGATVTF